MPRSVDGTHRPRSRGQVRAAGAASEASTEAGANDDSNGHDGHQPTKDTSMQKTVIGSFDSYSEAQRVVDDLKSEGFMASDISIVASNVRGDAASGATDVGSDTTRPDDTSGAATGAVTGGVIGGAAGLAASLMGLAIPGIGPILAAGPIVAALTGAGVGAVAGGLIGGLTDLGVSEEDAQYYAESVRRGGALVTLRADESRAERAADIMRRHGAVDIERRVETWRQTGWSGFDPKARPYTRDDIEREHAMYGTSAAGTTRTTASGGRGVTDNMGTVGGVGGSMGATGGSGSMGAGAGGLSGSGRSGSATASGMAGMHAGTMAPHGTPRTSAEWEAYDSDFRSDWEQNYAKSGGRYEDYQPAYQHGFEAAGRYRGRNWTDVESDVQRDWESTHPSADWQRVKNAARRGWQRMSDAVERATPGDSDRDGK